MITFAWFNEFEQHGTVSIRSYNEIVRYVTYETDTPQFCVVMKDGQEYQVTEETFKKLFKNGDYQE